MAGSMKEHQRAANVPMPKLSTCPIGMKSGLTRPALAGFGLILGLALSNPAMADRLQAPSRIQSILLYPDAATISREILLDLPAGAHEIIIDALPATIDPQSLRLEGAGEAKIRIGALTLRPDPAVGAPDAALQARLAPLRHERDELADRLDAIEGRKAMILRFAQGGPGGDGREVKPLEPESWTKAWELVGKGLLEVNADLRGLRIQMERVDREIAALEAALPPPEKEAPRQIVQIDLSAEQQGKARLTLSYLVRGAGWRPIYDAKLETAGNKPRLLLTRRAMIQQQTGEDWREVKLTLSTLRARHATAAPALAGEKVVIAPPPIALGRNAAAPAAARRQLDQAASAEKRVAEPIEEEAASLAVSPYQSEFTLPGTVFLESGRAEKSVQLAFATFDPSLTHKSVPILDPTAYLEARFTLTGEAPLLAGEVLLSRDSTFIGRGRLAAQAPGEIVSLGFGADDQVKVKRVPILRQTRESGIFGNFRSDERRFRTEIINLHAFPIEIDVLDRMPISEDQEITVERLPEMTKPDRETIDDVRGVFAWQATLKPQENRAFITAYRLRWPAGKDLHTQNLPR